VKLVVIFLNRVEYLEDLLTAFLEIGVGGATVIDSVGMGRIISHQVPIFAGLRSAFPGSSPSNKTILAVVEDEQVGELATIAEDVCGSFSEPGTGLMIVLSVENLLGYRPES
jgi:nitrogen regulatory protein PII